MSRDPASNAPQVGEARADGDVAAAPRRRISWAVLTPLIVFAGMAVFFALALKTGDPSRLPSALIGKPVPQIEIGPLEGLISDGRPVPGITTASLPNGTPYVVNFWASWCVPCVAEHPMLVELKKRTGVPILGVNYKDQAANARRFLSRYGNPFVAVGVDGNGRAAIEWGVYGMPETFIVDAKGRIAYKHVGPITEESLEQAILPALERAKTGG